MFTVTLDNVDATPPSAKKYSYTIKVKDEYKAAWDNFVFTCNNSIVFNNYAHQQGDGVTIGLKKLTVTLPTYLAATATEGAAKAAFVFGKTIKKDIRNQIVADILALNPKLAPENIKSVKLPTTSDQMEDNSYPVKGHYDYTVELISSDYSFVFEIEGAETTEADGVTTAVKAVAVLAPGIVITIEREDIQGKWIINQDGYPEYNLANLTLNSYDYGYDLVTIEENPDGSLVSLTKDRWNNLFDSNQLNWALYRNDNLLAQGKTLNSVLVDYVKENLTNGTYKLRIIDARTLRISADNFGFQLDADLANLKVTPATVEVKAAKDSYTKVYGREVTKANDLSSALNFATEPILKSDYTNLKEGQNIIDLFETCSPEDANVYNANALVGEYQIRAVAGVKDMFIPVVGVKFAPSATQSTVQVTKAPLSASDVTIKVSATREYGDDPTSADVHVDVSGKSAKLTDDFRNEISRVLNAEDLVRTTWIDWTAFNKKTNVGKYELRFTSSAVAEIIAKLENFNVAGAAVVIDSLTITKAPLTVSAKSYSRPYGTANPELEIEYIGLKNNEYENLADVFSVMPEVATDAQSDSRGTYSIYFKVKGVARNYEVAHENGTLAIDKIPRKIIWPEDQRNLVIHVGETVSLSAYLESEADGKPSIDNIEYVLSNNDRDRVVLFEVSKGVYAVTGNTRTENGSPVTITVSAKGDDTYEDATPVTGTIQVVEPDGDAAKVNVIISNVISVYDGNPRTVSVKVIDVDKNEEVKDFSIYYEGDQFASIPTLYPSTQEAPTNAGVYTVKVSGSLGAASFAYQAKNKMVIAPKPVVVTARSFNINYGQALPSYENAYDYNKNDFLNGEDFLINQAPVVRIEGYNGKAGTYKLTPYSAQDFGRNYALSFVSGQLTINKAVATVKADNKESVYGKDLEELTYTVSGLVNGETLKDLGFAPRISSTVTRTSDAGAYPITFADNYTSDNYDISYVDGKYTIIPASQKISWSPETVINVEDGDVILNASATSKLPVTFDSSNNAVAYVNEVGDTWYLTPVTSGTVTITAYQHGNKNYFGAEPVAVTFIVDDELLSVDNEKITVADQIEVYPRLFTHSVTVAAPSEIKQVELLTMSGVLQHVISKPGSVIDLSSFGPGIYLLNVTLEDGTFRSVKIIKK